MYKLSLNVYSSGTEKRVIRVLKEKMTKYMPIHNIFSLNSKIYFPNHLQSGREYDHRRHILFHNKVKSVRLLGLRLVS